MPLSVYCNCPPFFGLSFLFVYLETFFRLPRGVILFPHNDNHINSPLTIPRSKFSCSSPFFLVICARLLFRLHQSSWLLSDYLFPLLTHQKSSNQRLLFFQMRWQLRCPSERAPSVPPRSSGALPDGRSPPQKRFVSSFSLFWSHVLRFPSVSNRSLLAPLG